MPKSSKKSYLDALQNKYKSRSASKTPPKASCKTPRGEEASIDVIKFKRDISVSSINTNKRSNYCLAEKGTKRVERKKVSVIKVSSNLT